MKALFVTDLHGNVHAYERSFRIAEKENLDIILGGDLTPKMVAIRLKDQEIDERKPWKVKHGEILPAEMIAQEKPNNTFTSSLQEIRQLNKKIKPGVLAKQLQKRGYILYDAKTRFYELQVMLEDNLVIDKLCDFFRLTPAMREKHPLEFSKTEVESLECLVQSIKEIEDEFSDEKKRRLEETWNCRLDDLRGYQTLPFRRISIGSTLMNYVLFRNKIGKMQRQHDRILEAINSSDPQVKAYFRSSLEEALKDIKIAVRMADLYDSKFFEILGEHTTIKELRDKAMSDEVYLSGQERFVNGYLRRRLSLLRKRNPKLRVFAILGNDDREEIDEDMKKLNEDGLLVYIQDSSVDAGEGIAISGYPFVRSSRGIFYPGWEREESEIADDLEKIASQSDPKRTIYVIHSPPHNTGLDISFDDEHIGSIAVREFIEKFQPYLTLHGHAHESPTISGRYVERIGRTRCINPGSTNEYTRGKLRAVILDTKHLDSIQYGV